MGRRNKAYFKDLHQQAYDRLTGMQAFGESKKEAVANGTEKDKIFAFNTYKSYWKHTKYFIKYIKEKHPECTTLKSAKKYANEWLQTRVDQGLSAWTVQLEAKALGKLYGISPDDENYYTITLWETVLQSPYSVDFTEEQARYQIHEDLMQHEDGKEWALSRIGICEKPDPKFCDPFEYNEIMENENVLVRYQLRANYQARRGEKTGFWDIILVHQKPIPQVPKDMRP